MKEHCVVRHYVVPRMDLRTFCVFLVLGASLAEEETEVDGVKLPTRCETCKILAVELQNRLQETGKTHEVLEIGYGFDKEKKRKKYATSELRLLETLENLCDSMLQYNLHKERHDSTRFAKGMSQTFKTLHGLKAKGVKVDLGIPEDLWDTPPVEVTALKNRCENLLEEYEDDISHWYFNLQDEVSLGKFICAEKVLSPGEDKCLGEELPPSTETSDDASSNSKEEL